MRKSIFHLCLAIFSPLLLAGNPRTVSLVIDGSAGKPAQHGVGKLEAALRTQGWAVEQVGTPETAHGDRIVIARVSAAGGTQGSEGGRNRPTALPESLSIRKLSIGDRPALQITGSDSRGLMYALLDTADRVSWAKTSADPFSEVREISEQPSILDRTLSVYTMNRANWESRFYDEAYWTRYFDLLASNRFNRFLIIFGYENGGFLAPPYPYFFDTDGFPGVHMVDCTPEQQRRNVASLNRLIELAHERGIAVSLGIWDHIYRGEVQTGGAEWVDSYKGRPVPNSVVGVTTENLNAYTLASLKELLEKVPTVDGIQFRVHEESGLKREEMGVFWHEVFQHLKKHNPGMFVELRGKGTPDSIIEDAISQGVNLRVETKFWMEQMGLPFHPTHTNPQDQRNRRHGYADFLRYPQRYKMDWRLWNGGTTRVLLWGDPEYVRRYSASAQLYDSPSWDVQEPLATKMEAQSPDMPPFELMPAKYRYYDYEFERYWHFFQVWGRVGYNPETSAEPWRHEFERRFGNAAAAPLEDALHLASRVLPMIVASQSYPYSGFPTTRGWAERQSLGATLESYASNTGTDVQQFESFSEAARRILADGITSKRTPEATSRWFEQTAAGILEKLRVAEACIGTNRNKEFDSTSTDLRILSQLARFHARRFCAAVHFNLFNQGGNPAELLAATNTEEEAVAAWRELVSVAGDRYAFDLAMGARNFSLCGHWRDELVELEADLRKLKAQCLASAASTTTEKAWKPADFSKCRTPFVEAARIQSAKPGVPLRITASVRHASGVASVTLRYRHLTQYEDYETLAMPPTGTPGEFAATVPGDFLIPRWDFMYFIEAISKDGTGTQWPDLEREAPYVIVKLERTDTP